MMIMKGTFPARLTASSFFQDLGQLESTAAGTRYISIRPRHRTNAHYAAEFQGMQQERYWGLPANGIGQLSAR